MGLLNKKYLKIQRKSRSELGCFGKGDERLKRVAGEINDKAKLLSKMKKSHLEILKQKTNQ